MSGGDEAADENQELTMRGYTVHSFQADHHENEGEVVTFSLCFDSDDQFRWYENGLDMELSEASAEKAWETAVRVMPDPYRTAFEAQCPPPSIQTYQVCDDNGEPAVVPAASAKAAAAAYVAGGDYGPTGHQTTWVRCSVRQLDTLGQVVDEDEVEVRVDPKTPCTKGWEHDWQTPHQLVGGDKSDPGVFAAEKGTLFVEVCARCGTERRRFSHPLWNTGKGEGVQVTPRKFAAEVAALADAGA